MAATRVIDDHLELANIGSNTHSQIDSHIADPSAHHVPYTDAGAVAAMGAKADANPLHHDRPILHACHISSYAQQQVPHNSAYWIQFGHPSPAQDPNIYYNYGNMYDSDHITQIQINRDGIYLIVYVGYWDANANGSWRGFDIYKNATPIAGQWNSHAPQNMVFYQTCTTVTPAEAGDYIRVNMYQDSGGNLFWQSKASTTGIYVSMLREI